MLFNHHLEGNTPQNSSSSSYFSLYKCQPEPVPTRRMPLEDLALPPECESDPYIPITKYVCGDYPFVTASQIEIDIWHIAQSVASSAGSSAVSGVDQAEGVAAADDAYALGRGSPTPLPSQAVPLHIPVQLIVF